MGPTFFPDPLFQTLTRVLCNSSGCSLSDCEMGKLSGLRGGLCEPFMQSWTPTSLKGNFPHRDVWESRPCPQKETFEKAVRLMHLCHDGDSRSFQSALCVRQTQREPSSWSRMVLCWPHKWTYALHPTPPLWMVRMPFLSFLLYCAGELRLLHSSFRHSTDFTGSWQVTRRRIFVFHSEVAPVNTSFS